MDQHNAVVYQPGQRIDPSRPLQVENLPRNRWGPIASVYPEIAFILQMGIDARFFGTRNTTIFPSTMISRTLLKNIKTWQGASRHVYSHVSRGGNLLAVVVHVVGRGGGYDSIHIYGYYPRPRRRFMRRRTAND